jgi:hypothetical protein
MARVISLGAFLVVVAFLCGWPSPPGRGDNHAKEEPKKGADSRQLDKLWTTLGGKDAAKAYRAIWALVAMPEKSVSLLRRHLRPVDLPDQRRIGKLIADLNNQKYAVRKRANRELETLAELAKPALLKAQERSSSVEMRERFNRLLGRIDQEILTPQQVQILRAIEVLEQIETPEARKVLHQVAKGAPEARITVEAKGSLQRLTNRARRSP